MLGYDIIHRIGAIVRHVLGVLLLCWRRMIRTALITWCIAFLLVEIAGAITARQFPAPILTHVVALIFALATAYGAMVTVLLDELVIGAVDTIKFIEGDVEAGARAATMIAEHEVGLLPLLGWLGLAPKRSTLAQMAPRRQKAPAQPAQPAQAAQPIQPAQPAQATPATSDTLAETPTHTASEQLAQTQADVAATDAFSETAPRPRVNARPVRADQLPRITWAMEQLAQQEPQQEQPAAIAQREPAPVDQVVAAPATVPLDTADTTTTHTAGTAASSAQGEDRTTAAPSPLVASTQAPLAPEESAEEPLPFVIAPHIVPLAEMYPIAPVGSTGDDHTGDNDVQDVQDVQDDIATGHYSDGPTQNGASGYHATPSAPASTTNGREQHGQQRGIWSRISKTLVGNVHPPATTPLDTTFQDDVPLN